MLQARSSYLIYSRHLEIRLPGIRAHRDLGDTGGLEVKASASNVGDLGLIPGLRRYPRQEMATHSSILAWRIPWTEEPGRLQSMGSQSQT